LKFKTAGQAGFACPASCKELYPLPKINRYRFPKPGRHRFGDFSISENFRPKIFIVENQTSLVKREVPRQ
jgi:hypothetical protein